MQKKMNALLIALFALMVTIMIMGTVFKPKEKTVDVNDYYYCSYEIKWGDSYWTIAEEYKMPDDDIREWIATVKRINGVKTDYLRSGCHVIILAKKG